MMVDTNFSTLSLAPQELASYMLDFENKVIYLKQKNSCVFYEIITSLKSDEDVVDAAVKLEEEKEKKKTDNLDLGSIDISNLNLPNVQQLFDMFAYVMYHRGQVDIKGKKLEEFKYFYPLGVKAGEYDAPSDTDFLMYFDSETMGLERLVLKSEAINSNVPIILYATQPIVAKKWTKEDMDF